MTKASLHKLTQVMLKVIVLKTHILQNYPHSQVHADCGATDMTHFLLCECSSVDSVTLSKSLTSQPLL